MRINSVAAAVGAALLARGAYAKDTQEESSSSVAPQAPTFTVRLLLLLLVVYC